MRLFGCHFADLVVGPSKIAKLRALPPCDHERNSSSTIGQIACRGHRIIVSKVRSTGWLRCIGFDEKPFNRVIRVRHVRITPLFVRYHRLPTTMISVANASRTAGERVIAYRITACPSQITRQLIVFVARPKSLKLKQPRTISGKLPVSDIYGHFLHRRHPFRGQSYLAQAPNQVRND
jgi:hypothetical protein